MVSSGFQRALDTVNSVQGNHDNLPNNSELPEADRELSTTLYYVLTMCTRERAMRVIQQATPGTGYLAWWRLKREMQPICQGRYLGVLQSVLNLKFVDEATSLDTLQYWERLGLHIRAAE